MLRFPAPGRGQRSVAVGASPHRYRLLRQVEASCSRRLRPHQAVIAIRVRAATQRVGSVRMRTRKWPHDRATWLLGTEIGNPNGVVFVGTLTLDPEQWAVEQFGDCDLGDLRRTRRAVKFA